MTGSTGSNDRDDIRVETPPGLPGGRVELLPLDEDCLRDGTLHEGIRLRLLRIRELPSRSVATLLGVWRRGGRPWIAWESIPGPTLQDLLDGEPIPDARATRIIESLRRAVLALHRQGLVHGDLRASNVVLCDELVILTRLSPLLYHDPRRDLDALAALEDDLRRRTASPPPGAAATAERSPDPRDVPHPRDRRGWIAVTALLASGAMVSLAAWWLTRRGA